MKAFIIAALTAGAFTACTPPEEIQDHPCPPNMPLTYDNWGKSYLDANCNSCHSADDGSRHGAPGAIRFDTLDDVHTHSDRIFVRAAASNTTMPPGPKDPPADQRKDLADWLACGAP